MTAGNSGTRSRREADLLRIAVDPLDEFLARVHTSTLVTGHFNLGAPWSIGKDGVQGIAIRLARGTRYTIQLVGHQPILVEPDDVVLLPHGDAHVMSSDPAQPAVRFDHLLEERGIPYEAGVAVELEAGGDGSLCELHTLILGFEECQRPPLFSILPSILHFRAADPTIAPWIKSALRAAIEDSIEAPSATMISISRLADILLAQAVRSHVRGGLGRSASWTQGLLDNQVGQAILAVHRAPGEGWDVGKLARLAGMSRSRFAARFTELVGQAPMAYVTGLRMQLASMDLAHPSVRVSTVAERLGYKSDKAFTRAFRRWTGTSPKAFGSRYVDLLEPVPAVAPSRRADDEPLISSRRLGTLKKPSPGSLRG